MAKQTIDRGTAANDGTGDNLRVGAAKINDNFDEIYNAIGDGTNLISGTIVSDISSATFQNKVIDSANNTLTLDLSEGTLTGTTAEFNTALSDGSFATLAGSEPLTNKTIDASLNTLSNIANGSLTNSSITLIDDSSTTDAVSLGENLRFTGGTGITSIVGANQVTFNIDNTVATLSGIQTLTSKTINAPDNTITNISNTNLSGTAGITNANLANPSISIGGITFNLGDTDATPALDLTDATNYPTTSLTGTITNAQLAGSIENGKLVNSTITIGDDTLNLGDTQTTITNLSLDGATGTINLTSSGNLIRFNVAYVDTAALDAAISSTTYEGAFAYNTTENIPYVADAAGWTKLISENNGVGDLSNVNISGIAANDSLVWNSGNARFEPVGGINAPWQTKTNVDSPYTAISGERLFVDTTGGAVTINLPATPSVGDEVYIIDADANSGTNAITVGRNGSNINGAASDGTISTNGDKKHYVYYSASRGWIEA